MASGEKGLLPPVKDRWNSYAFNGVLVGIALSFFFGINVLLIGFIISGSALSSLVMNFMHKRKLAPYTFPFVLSAWIVIILIKFFNLVPEQTRAMIEVTSWDILSPLTMSVGQVMFQANVTTGIIFIAALLISSRISTIYALMGSLIGALISFGLSFPLNLVNIGIFGFNGVLCGIAFADKKERSIIYAAISIVLSVFIIFGMLTFNVVALSAPFVFATWITLGLRKFIGKE